jgi:elongator complex protein 5
VKNRQRQEEKGRERVVMPPSAQSHSRSHALLLLQKLLNLRDGASPLTLLLDTLEQSAKPVIREFIARAKVCS